jgi:23S rRNA (uracil1939-C5)-methyltransferase
MSEIRQLRVDRALYGGAFSIEDASITPSFVLPKELIELADDELVRIVEAAPDRIVPQCPHFESCGGCQYQMASDREQLDIKLSILRDEMARAGVTAPREIAKHIAESYGYRNRIRLRIHRVDGELLVGYNIRTTTEFLPITTCPIAAPVLWSTAEKLLASSADRDAAFWLDAASEVELFCNDDLTRVQGTLLCAPRTKAAQGSLQRTLNALRQLAPQVTGLHAIASDPRTGPTGRTLDSVGTPGLNYKVGDETYWISRGGFFQVNRFLISTLVSLVADGRSGETAWDLFAGVGLFSRVLAKNFTQVTAVEANPTATADLRAALSKLGPQHRAVEQTTLDFLRAAVIQRERPGLIVLDPPRAGAGLEVCALLGRIAAPQIVYVSCDPTTLARDLCALQADGYRIGEIHLVDLFPQTFHIETVVTLIRET